MSLVTAFIALAGLERGRRRLCSAFVLAERRGDVQRPAIEVGIKRTAGLVHCDSQIWEIGCRSRLSGIRLVPCKFVAQAMGDSGSTYGEWWKGTVAGREVRKLSRCNSTLETEMGRAGTLGAVLTRMVRIPDAHQILFPLCNGQFLLLPLRHNQYPHSL